MKALQNSRRRWGTIQVVGGVLISAFLAYLIVRGLDWSSFAAHLRSLPLDQFLFASGAFLGGILLRAWRWHVLIVRESISLFRLFLIQNAGIGLNNLSPVRVVSEPLQLMLIARRSNVSAGTGLATLVMEHLMDVFATAALLALGVLAWPQLRGLNPQFVGAVVFSAISLVIFLLITRGMNAVPGARKIAFLRTATIAFRTLGRRPARLLLSLFGTFAHWGLLGLAGWITANALGIEMGVAAVVVVFMGSIFTVSAIPSPPGGAVTFEAAVVYTLGVFGVDREVALAFALIMHVIMFVPSTVIAMLVLPGEGVKMFGRKDAPVTAEQSTEEPSHT